MSVCKFRGPSLVSSKFYDNQSASAVYTYIVKDRILPDPFLDDGYYDTYYNGNKSDQGSRGPVYVKALFTDKTARDWFALNNLVRGGEGGQPYRIAYKEIEAVVLSSRTDDGWVPGMYSFQYSAYAGAPYWPFAYFSFDSYQPAIILDKSCGVSPLSGCSSSIVLPATSDGDSEFWTRQKGETWRKQFLW